MDLGGRVRSAVLRQHEAAASNYFTCVDDMRDFLNIPSAGAEITVKMACFVLEHLRSHNDTRVSLVDYLAHAFIDTFGRTYRSSSL